VNKIVHKNLHPCVLGVFFYSYLEGNNGTVTTTEKFSRKNHITFSLRGYKQYTALKKTTGDEKL